MDQLAWLEQHVDLGNYVRTCLYLVSTCAYLPEADDRAVLHAALSIYRKVGLSAILHAYFPASLTTKVMLSRADSCIVMHTMLSV